MSNIFQFKEVAIVMLVLLSGCDTPEERSQRHQNKALCAADRHLREYGYIERVTDTDKAFAVGGEYDPEEQWTKALNKTPHDVLSERFAKFSSAHLYAIAKVDRVTIVYYQLRGEPVCVYVARPFKNGVYIDPFIECGIHPEAVRVSQEDLKCES